MKFNVFVLQGNPLNSSYQGMLVFSPSLKIQTDACSRSERTLEAGF